MTDTFIGRSLSKYCNTSALAFAHLEFFHRWCDAFFLALMVVLFSLPATATEQRVAHALALFGTPKYGPDFHHFNYVNPDSPKGRRITLCVSGNFDSLNPFVIRAQDALGLSWLVFEPLMARSRDEAFTNYGVLAKSARLAPDRRTIIFELHDHARFADGRRVTTKDVQFSLELLREKGRPNMRATYRQVKSTRILSETEIEFTFADDAAWEAPLTVAWLPILPSHYYEAATFEDTGLKFPLASGPYEVSIAEAGNQVVYTRRDGFWGADLPVNRGRFNFDEVVVSYYRSTVAVFEAFKSGGCDLFHELDPTRWHTAYDFPALARGDVLRAEFAVTTPPGMEAFVFNTRRPPFSDIQVRQALALLFDAEHANKTLYSGLRRRTQSFFGDGELSSIGHPPSALEMALLEPYGRYLDPGVLAGTARQPASDGTGRDRRNAQLAATLLRAAGFRQRESDRAWVDGATGNPLQFTFSAVTREQERLFAGYATALKSFGIGAMARSVEPTAYQRLRTDFDFDALQFTWFGSPSPGNEQVNRWGSAAADAKGTFNVAGVKSPAVDAILAALLAAQDKEHYVAAVRALDRVLLSGAYVVPLFHSPVQWVAHRSHLRYPEVVPDDGYRIDTWWAQPVPRQSQ